MTVIAWDGKTLAADKRACTNGSYYTTTKIFRVDADRMAGFAGNPGRVAAFLEWLRAGAALKDFPPNPKEDSVWVLVVHRDGTIHKYQHDAGAIAVEDGRYAIGSGEAVARAAMYLGQCARGAVEITCLFDESCGNGTDTLTFEDISHV